ncbi:stage III sporulation protein AG [Priestia flexa]|uniref:stage III sporulation protein AG n=1 Tax=Priestia flexa TaxID=86664 RepID=UPI0020A0EEE3|nr:stage III sporulation protein AG [Priestia flexa]MCP1190561.1 stage III sporulation protein AG [Priestia flexa]
MNDKKEGASFLKRLFSLTKKSDDKKPSKLVYMGILLAAGMVFMLMNGSKGMLQSTVDEAKPASSTVQDQEDVPAFGSKKNTTITDYEKKYEEQLQDVLEQIDGVSKVEVIVNLDATEAKVYEKNTVTQKQSTDETDREGGKRKVEDISTDEKLVIVRSGDQEKPVVVKTEKPKIRGILVVAKGADNIEVKKWIIEAVTRSLDVPSHRVAVLPKKG